LTVADPCTAPSNCPDNITWTNTIATMFTPTDVAHMKQVTGNALDLSVYNDVKIWASAICERVASGSMPPPSSGEQAWTPAMVNTFGCWMQAGCPE
jgi:hypothetical protein